MKQNVLVTHLFRFFFSLSLSKSHHLVSSSAWLFGWLMCPDWPFAICSWVGICVLAQAGCHPKGARLPQAAVLLSVLLAIFSSGKNYTSTKSED